MTIKYMDPSKDPFALVVSQILADNPDTTMPEEVLNNYAFRNLVERTPIEGEEPQRNTSIEIDLLAAPSEVDGDWVSFNYHRFDLAELFNEIISAGTANVKGWEVVVDENGIVQSGLEAYIKTVYGLNITEGDGFYSIATSENQVTVSATAANPAFIGSVEFEVLPSLEWRVANNDTPGFLEPYTVPTIVGDLVIATPAISETGTLAIQLSVISENDFTLNITVDKDEPGSEGIVIDSYSLGEDLAPGTLAQTVEYPINVTAAAIAAALGVEDGELIDGYSVNLEIVHEGGSDSKSADFFIGNDLSTAATITYTGTAIKDISTATANYTVYAKTGVDLNLAGTTDSVFAITTVDGAVVLPDERVRLVQGQSYTVKVEFPADAINHNVVLTVSADNNTVYDAERVVTYGSLQNQQTVQEEPGLVVTAFTPESNTYTYNDTYLTSISVETNEAYTLNYYLEDVLVDTVSVAASAEVTEVSTDHSVAMVMGANHLKVEVVCGAVTTFKEVTVSRLTSSSIESLVMGGLVTGINAPSTYRSSANYKFKGDTYNFTAKYTAVTDSYLIWYYKGVEVARDTVVGSATARYATKPIPMTEVGAAQIRLEIKHIDESATTSKYIFTPTIYNFVDALADFAYDFTQMMTSSYNFYFNLVPSTAINARVYTTDQIGTSAETSTTFRYYRSEYDSGDRITIDNVYKALYVTVDRAAVKQTHTVRMRVYISSPTISGYDLYGGDKTITQVQAVSAL